MNRQSMVEQLSEVHEWDILIVGGGATGLGAAVDAASRGLKTLLIEQADFAKGTSGRSTKLLHGGVRYMAQGNIGLVRESLKERWILLKNAPHICRKIPFVIPAFRKSEKWLYGIGLKIYDFLSGRKSIGKTTMLSKKQVSELLPTLDDTALVGGVQFYDGQFNDSRLAITLALTAADHGATLLNYCKLVSFTKTDYRITGVLIIDYLSGRKHNIKCKAVINAAGVFADDLLILNNPQHQPVITASQGIHLVVDKRFFPGSHALLIPKTDDGRVLFAVPWQNKVLIGTTDTPVNKISLEPVAIPEEVDYVLSHINRLLPRKIERHDVLSVFAGLRPLTGIKGNENTSLLSRDYNIMISVSGLVNITGGKWTTYRKMGETAVDHALMVAKLPHIVSATASLKLHGYTIHNDYDNPLHVYGSDTKALLLLTEEEPELKKMLHPRLPYSMAQVAWAVRYEMAYTLDDLLSRRTRALILDAAAAKEAAIPLVAWMAKELNKSDAWQEHQLYEFNQIAEAYLIH